MHGQFRFFRQIRFDDVTKDQEDVLVEKLMASGHKPGEGALDFGDRVKLWRGEELPADISWKRALKFF